jgi:hypothetical protein
MGTSVSPWSQALLARAAVKAHAEARPRPSLRNSLGYTKWRSTLFESEDSSKQTVRFAIQLKGERPPLTSHNFERKFETLGYYQPLVVYYPTPVNGVREATAPPHEKRRKRAGHSSGWPCTEIRGTSSSDTEFNTNLS